MGGFKEFTGKDPAAGPRTVTVTPRGVLLLSRAAFLALGEPRSVRLHADHGEGVAAVAAAHRGRFPVRRQGRGGRQPAVSAKAFCDSLGLDLSAARRFPVTVENGRAVFDYRAGPSAVVARNGAAKKEGPGGQGQA